MNEPKLGGGNVTIRLDGEEVILKPSLQAAQTISRQAGGLAGAMQAVLKLDLDVVTTVVGLGLGYGGTKKPPQDLAEKIWRSGLTDASEGALASGCILFLRVLANGGQMPNDDVIVEDGQEGDNHPNSRTN